jgi:hypothetical protein
MVWINIVVVILAVLSLVTALLSLLRALQQRNSVSTSAYGVGRQAARRKMQVAFIRAAILGVVALILFAVYGLSARPDDVLSTEPEAVPTTAVLAGTATTASTEAPTQPAARATATTTPTATATVPPATATATATPTITPTSVPSAIVNSEVGLYLRPEPGSNVELELLPNGTELVLLDGLDTVDDVEWQQVRAPSGLEGWVAVDFITYQQ